MESEKPRRWLYVPCPECGHPVGERVSHLAATPFWHCPECSVPFEVSGAEYEAALARSRRSARFWRTIGFLGGMPDSTSAE